MKAGPTLAVIWILGIGGYIVNGSPIVPIAAIIATILILADAGGGRGFR